MLCPNFDNLIAQSWVKHSDINLVLMNCNPRLHQQALGEICEPMQKYWEMGQG